MRDTRAATPKTRLPPTVFGVAFGSAGLASTWTAAADFNLAPSFVADVLWCVVAVVLAVSVYEYGRRAGGVRGAVADVRESVCGMYFALVPAVALLLGSHLARESHLVGNVVMAGAGAVAIVLGAWFTVRVLSGMRSRTVGVMTWHGGYLLPTASTPLIASQVLASVNMTWMAGSLLVFGLGCWVVVWSVLLTRLARGISVPRELRMTLAIAASPPSMAGNAWFALHATIDDTQIWLLITVVVSAVVQAALIRLYVGARFNLGWWSVAFAATANATYALHWACATKPPGWPTEVAICLVVASLAVAAIAARSFASARSVSTNPQLLL